MTNNQKQILDSLIREFESINSTKSNSGLIDLEFYDSVNRRHKENNAMYETKKSLMKDKMRERIEDLIVRLNDELKGRLIVVRGDKINGNSNYRDSIVIYHQNTKYIRENGMLIFFELKNLTIFDDITKEYYSDCIGFELRGDYNKPYADEIEFFNCAYTKRKLTDMLFNIR